MTNSCNNNYNELRHNTNRRSVTYFTRLDLDALHMKLSRFLRSSRVFCWRTNKIAILSFAVDAWTLERNRSVQFNVCRFLIMNRLKKVRRCRIQLLKKKTEIRPTYDYFWRRSDRRTHLCRMIVNQISFAQFCVRQAIRLQSNHWVLHWVPCMENTDSSWPHVSFLLASDSISKLENAKMASDQKQSTHCCLLQYVFGLVSLLLVI